MNIIHFETTDEDRQLLSSLGDNGQHLEDKLTADTVSKAKDAEIVSIFVNSVVDQAVINQLPNLKLLITRSVGFDHIDSAYAQSKGITICNVPGYGSCTVAEFAFALILGLSRKVYHAIEQVKEKNDWSMSQFKGFDLQGKTLGLVGTGRIGLNVAQIANGFGMSVIAHDAFPQAEKATQYNFSYTASLDELLSKSDVVTLHVPATKETHHLINQTNIDKFKPGAILVNTARGDVVDAEAILHGFNSGILSGVGLDVLEGEHELKEEAELMSKDDHMSYEKLKVLLEDHVLINHPKVIITPHIAFNTEEAKKEIMTITLDNIKSFEQGQPKNVVQIQK